ncbi:MAG: hypothetical protein JST16_08790 [Bdellovibrionales bacterium]|nr:hypothetical protein [Bdellovibrionales bacterium]
MFKKIAIGFAVLIVVFIGVLVAIPFFYSIDSLRPQIQAAVEKQVHGKVELGKLSLRLFPDVRVGIDGLRVTPAAPYDQEALANIKGVAISLPLSSFLTGPKATVVIEGPKVVLISKGTSSNLSTLLPPPTPEQQAAAAKEAAAAPKGAGNKTVDETLASLPPFIASRVKAARLSFALTDGSVEMRKLDAPRNDKTLVHDLNVHLDNMNLSAPIGIKVDVVVDVVAGETKISGPLKTEGSITATPEGAGFRVALDVDEDMTGLDAKFSNLFHKKPGIPFSAGLKGTVVQGEAISADLPEIEFRFGGFKTKSLLAVTDANVPEKAKIKFSMKSGETDIGPFGAIIPMIADYKLGGRFSLAVDAAGPMVDPTMNVLVGLNNVTGATPQLQKPVSNLTGKILVQGTAKNPSIKIDPFSMKLASSDLTLKVETRGLENISANIAVQAKRMDADELLGLKVLKLDEKVKKTEAQIAEEKEKAKLPLDEALAQTAPTLEQSLDNPMLDKIAATISLDVKSLRAMGAEFNNATFNMSYAKRELKISKTGIGGYGGRVDLAGNFGLTPKAPAYDIKAGLNGVKLEEVTKAHAQSWNGMVTGAMTGEFALSGRGLRKEQLQQNLSGGLKGEVRDGVLNLPVVKLVDMVMDKLPQGLGQKAAGAAKGKESKGAFKTMKLVSSIRGRMVEIQDLDVNYDTLTSKVGEMRFQAKGTVSFDQDVDIAGIAYLPMELVHLEELKGPSGKCEIPLKMKGRMNDPQPDYGYSLGILGPRIAQNALKGRVGNAAKAAAAPAIQKAQEKLLQNAPAPAKKAVDDLKKKFGF